MIKFVDSMLHANSGHLLVGAIQLENEGPEVAEPGMARTGCGARTPLPLGATVTIKFDVDETPIWRRVIRWRGKRFVVRGWDAVWTCL